jgi:membrane-associated HD superfamily phosphohydrolase
MLADSVQAAVQMVITPSKGEMEEIVEKVIKTKADSGQLQDCHLTFKDLGTISQAFIMVLSGMHHSRTGYIPAPPEPKPEEPIIEAEG